MMGDLHQKIAPLMKEQRALKLQLKGKMATPGTTWDQISGLVSKINAKHAEISTLRAKAQFELYQKTGVMLPPPHVKMHKPGRA